MMLTWKYTLPAFLVPFVFTLSPAGMGLLLQADAVTIVWVFIFIAIFAPLGVRRYRSMSR